MKICTVDCATGFGANQCVKYFSINICPIRECEYSEKIFLAVSVCEVVLYMRTACGFDGFEYHDENGAWRLPPQEKALVDFMMNA